MTLRHRLLATVTAMLVAWYGKGRLWLAMFDFPSPLAGMAITPARETPGPLTARP